MTANDRKVTLGIDEHMFALVETLAEEPEGEVPSRHSEALSDSDSDGGLCNYLCGSYSDSVNWLSDIITEELLVAQPTEEKAYESIDDQTFVNNLWDATGIPDVDLLLQELDEPMEGQQVHAPNTVLDEHQEEGQQVYAPDIVLDEHPEELAEAGAPPGVHDEEEAIWNAQMPKRGLPVEWHAKISCLFEGQKQTNVKKCREMAVADGQFGLMWDKLVTHKSKIDPHPVKKSHRELAAATISVFLKSAKRAKIPENVRIALRRELKNRVIRVGVLRQLAETSTAFSNAWEYMVRRYESEKLATQYIKQILANKS